MIADGCTYEEVLIHCLDCGTHTLHAVRVQDQYACHRCGDVLKDMEMWHCLTCNHREWIDNDYTCRCPPSPDAHRTG